MQAKRQSACVAQGIVAPTNGACEQLEGTLAEGYNRGDLISAMMTNGFRSTHFALRMCSPRLSSEVVCAARQDAVAVRQHELPFHCGHANFSCQSPQITVLRSNETVSSPMFGRYQPVRFPPVFICQFGNFFSSSSCLFLSAHRIPLWPKVLLFKTLYPC